LERSPTKRLVTHPVFPSAQNANQPETPPHSRNFDWFCPTHMPQTGSVPNHTLPYFRGKYRLQALPYFRMYLELFDSSSNIGVTYFEILAYHNVLIIAWSHVRILPDPLFYNPQKGIFVLISQQLTVTAVRICLRAHDVSLIEQFWRFDLQQPIDKRVIPFARQNRAFLAQSIGSKSGMLRQIQSQ
jgi:hypothetical protein